jgi:antitoxin (DNA-binding transcriptional repressor) of toxin-antitoxin stability system
MKTVNIREAKTHLSKLVDQAAKGESFIIAKAASRLSNSLRLTLRPVGRVQRLGFMAGQIEVPDDFDRMGRVEIERMFE